MFKFPLLMSFISGPQNHFANRLKEERENPVNWRCSPPTRENTTYTKFGTVTKTPSTRKRRYTTLHYLTGLTRDLPAWWGAE